MLHWIGLWFGSWRLEAVPLDAWQGRKGLGRLEERLPNGLLDDIGLDESGQIKPEPCRPCLHSRQP